MHQPPSQTPSQRDSRKAGERTKMLSTEGLRNFWNRLSTPIDIAWLVVFRIAFGGIMLWEVWRYFDYGWIGRYWKEPLFWFTYYGFSWVEPWPGDLMYVHFVVLGALALAIMVGFFYRIATVLFFLGFSYVFLLDQARYLNHFYLIVLLSFLMVLIPAHRAFSFDAWRRPSTARGWTPWWTLWILRLQIGVAYFYGGIAKLNTDWLQGEPMRIWLKNLDINYDTILGWGVSQNWSPYFFSYGGLLYDLAIVPLLLWRKTRPWAFAATVFFHLSNSWMFHIGIFPWFMMAATTIFFDPDWPRALARRTMGWLQKLAQPPSLESNTPSSRSLSTQILLVIILVFAGFQILYPFRHLLYPGNVNWTEEGHRFSWHMKLRTKRAKGVFYVVDTATGRRQEIDPYQMMPDWQCRKMLKRPDMILQFCHYLADEAKRQGTNDVEVYADVQASLNGRSYQHIVDPEINLAAQPRTLRHEKWILPLTVPLNE